MDEHDGTTGCTLSTTPGWRAYVRIHPACDALPLLPPDQLRELADDIRENGLKVKIQMWGRHVTAIDGSPKVAVLIDGRNRLDACALLGWPIIDRETGEWHRDFKEHVTGSTVLSVDPSGDLDHDEQIARDVVSRNIRRRHLSEQERVWNASSMVSLPVSARERPPTRWRRT